MQTKRHFHLQKSLLPLQELRNKNTVGKSSVLHGTNNFASIFYPLWLIAQWWSNVSSSCADFANKYDNMQHGIDMKGETPTNMIT